MKWSVKYICMTGIGIALFAALTLCLQVPVFENYYLCLGYVAMAVYCYCVGTVSGTIVGALGVVAYCLITSGLRGMPGWTIGNIVIGLALGLVFRLLRGRKMTPLIVLIYAATVILATAAGILGIKSIVEWILYAQPFIVRAAKNIYAFVADAVVLLVSLPVCMVIYPRVKPLVVSGR
ncbi:MAG: hypothetical protein E7233_11230 [Lachnospiraceae bacterium]|nr:hypothetical protein [Lachnospiraceae bacterium]